MTHGYNGPRPWASSYRSSRLIRYRAELVARRRAGVSYLTLAAWLRTEHQIIVSHTTVLRFLNTLPEMQPPTPMSKATQCSGR
jgi:hypothetical protein